MYLSHKGYIRPALGYGKLVIVILFFFAIGGEVGELTLGSDSIVTVAFFAILLLAIWFVIRGGESKPSSPAGNGQRPS